MRDTMWIDKTRIEKYYAFPSGIEIETEDCIITIDIQVLGKLVKEGQRANPTIDFKTYVVD